jgi:hypothetical protein
MYYATGLPGWMRGGEYGGPYAYPSPYRKPDPEMEKRDLQNQAAALRSELDAIQKRLAAMEAGPAAQ